MTDEVLMLTNFYQLQVFNYFESSISRAVTAGRRGH